MSRYVDADKLKTIESIQSADFNSIESIRRWIDKQQTVNVVKVVRCKDCKYKVVTEEGEYNPEDIVCDYWQSDGLTENDYCSYGKEKEKE